MTKEVSVAPKERIRVKFKPANSDAREDGVELPLKMMMLGDYTGRADGRPVEQRELVNVHKDNFNDVLRAHDIAFDLRVQNKISEDPNSEALKANIKISSMRDFEPDQIARQVPELKSILDMREALVALKGPLGNMPSFRKAIQGIMDDDNARQKLLNELTKTKG